MTGVAAKCTSDVPRMLIDLRWMIPGEAGGLETVAMAFLRQLFATPGAADATIIVPNQLLDRVARKAPPWVRLLSRDGLRSDLRSMRGRVTGGRLSLPSGVNLVYTMNGRIHPDFIDLPAVVLAADLQHFAFPELFNIDERAIRQEASRIVAGDAVRIITISEFSRQEIITRLQVEPARVAVAPLGVDSVFCAPPDSQTQAAVLARYRLAGERYVFFPAQLWPHKNHAGVLAAMEELMRAGETEPPLLVLTGVATTSYGAEFERILAASLVRHRVRWLGYVPRGDLPSLYAGAQALVFCSLYEGFGLPVIEAMGVGCPVICSNGTALAEVPGDAAILVDPTDPSGIAAAIRAVGASSELRHRLVARGFERARLFTWRNHFETVIACARAAAGLPPRDIPSARSYPPSVLADPGAGLQAFWRERFYPRLRRRLVRWLR